MNRVAASRALAITVPIAALATICLALLWTIGAIPRISIASEVVGLLAVLLAPGIAVEPAFHGGRWTLMERFGLAAALSLGLTGLFGVGLHLVGFPVSPPNVLGLDLVVAASVGLLSFRFRLRRPARQAPRAMRVEIFVGLGSLVLLAAGFVSILVLRAAPDQPPLEVMAVDGEGRLVAMPIRADPGRTNLTIVIRSASGTATSASLAVDGDGIRPWSDSAVTIGTGWTPVEVPIETTTTGTLLARVTVKGGGTQLSLPIAMDVAP
jgi:hypothetical protein